MGRAMSGDMVTFTSQRKAMLKSSMRLRSATIAQNCCVLRNASTKRSIREFEERLDVLETLIRDAWMLSLESSRLNWSMKTCQQNSWRSARTSIRSRAGDWILQIEDLREQLIVNVNRKVTTDALFW